MFYKLAFTIYSVILCVLTSDITEPILRIPNYYRDSNYRHAKDSKTIVGLKKVVISTPGMFALFVLHQSEAEHPHKESFCQIREILTANEIKRQRENVKNSDMFSLENFAFIRDRVVGLSFSSEYSVAATVPRPHVDGASSSSESTKRKVRFENVKEEATPFLGSDAEYKYGLTLKLSDYLPIVMESKKSKTSEVVGFIPDLPVIEIDTSITESKSTIKTKAFQLEVTNGAEYWFCASFIEQPNHELSISQYLISLKRNFSNRIGMGLIDEDGKFQPDKIIDKARVRKGEFLADELIPNGHAKITTKFGYVLNDILEANKINQQEGLDKEKRKSKSKKDKKNEGEENKYIKEFVCESILDIEDGIVKLFTVIKKGEVEKEPVTVRLSKIGMIITVIRKQEKNVDVLFTATLDGELNTTFKRIKGDKLHN